MKELISGLNADAYRVHALHDPERSWPETNCYTDLWIELLASLGAEPEAMLAFTVTQDFEGDQFTFFKVPLEDIESIYGIRVTELSIFDSLLSHVKAQMQRGRMALVEVDAHYLPDTRGVTYRQGHSKTTIAINGVDEAAGRMTYFHNAGYFSLDAQDFSGIFSGEFAEKGLIALYPYVEFVKFPERISAFSSQQSLALLARRLGDRPAENPFLQWQREFPAHLDQLLARPETYFHLYAFNTLRQAGANYELLASHLNWLGRKSRHDFQPAISCALQLSTSAKTLQFQLARAMARRKTQGLPEMISPMIDAYDQLMQGLDTLLGVKLAA